jgi:thiamine biosynthesis lipoprotein
MKKLTADLIVISLVTVLLLVCINEYVGPPEIERTEQVMGTYATITIINEDTTRANIAMDAAFDEITRIEALMSLYNKSSEVSSLNRAGTNWTALSRDTIYVLKKADYYSRISDGSFDITCNPLLNLWMVKAKKENRMPTPEEIDDARELVGYDQLVIDVEGNRARFEKDGMSITLGGIAKGYAVDCACKKLTEAGIKHALVNIGGDMRAVGAKNGVPWEVALQNPRDKSEYITIIKLDNESVTTSGDYERYFFEDGKRVHHIIDPQTGYSADDCISVTVITKNCIDADALSTAVFVMGPERGKALLDELGVVGVIISSDKRIINADLSSLSAPL